jgi:hypothetical protein
VSRGCLLALLPLALACGKYGPPVRAGEAQAKKEKPAFEVPLPQLEEPAEPEPLEPVREEEPPPEGAP